jgi:ABC-type glycerol-3-phosphate transport system substrate-binding protein
MCPSQGQAKGIYKMRKTLSLIAVLILSLASAGCGGFDRAVAGLTGNAETCVRGVLYYQFTSGASVAYDRNGKVIPC